MRKRFLIALLMGAFGVSLVHAQEEERPVPKTYEIKWRNVHEIMELVAGYVERVAGSEAFNLITVTANNRGHAVVSELIRKYDVPAKTVEFQFYLIKASSAGEGIKDGLPDNIRKVINGVAALTRYKSFELLDAPVLRASEGKKASLSGRATYFYNLVLARGLGIVTTGQNQRQIRVDDFGIEFGILVGGNNERGPMYKNVGVQTSFTIADGETIVIGASHIIEEPRVRDAASVSAAIVIVVTARILG